MNAAQLKEADAYTIAHEPVAPIDLMERAARQCIVWLLRQPLAGRKIIILCGKSGNGGDGLAIARLLAQQGVEAVVYILEFGKLGSPEFQTNLARLHQLPVSLHFIQSPDQFPTLAADSLIIDALYGVGLNKPLDGLSAALVQHVNGSGAEIISIDLPSGLFPNQSSLGNAVVRAQHTLTFETYKLALLVAENAPFIGEVHVLKIGLHPDFLSAVQADFSIVDEQVVKQLFKPRNRFAHKGTFGHALIVGGSWGKMGAAVLATSACLRSGAGLVTAFVPDCGVAILQTAAPEAMVMAGDTEKALTKLPDDLNRFSAVGLGPGLGTLPETGQMLYGLLKKLEKPAVLDADALNLLAKEPALLPQLFQNTILTPHPKEFERLFGPSSNDFDRIALARAKAAEFRIIIVLKGHYTLIALPDGSAVFNSTGNAGMAKGGSGDVLTGIITSLLAQNYSPEKAAILGVYLHGLSGDFAAQALSAEAMTARDLVTFLPQAFLKFRA